LQKLLFCDFISVLQYAVIQAIQITAIAYNEEWHGIDYTHMTHADQVIWYYNYFLADHKFPFQCCLIGYLSNSLALVGKLLFLDLFSGS